MNGGCNSITTNSNTLLPDKNGAFDYYEKDDLFPILKSNIDNGYIYVVTWDDFLKYPQADISIAFDHKEATPDYKIIKLL